MKTVVDVNILFALLVGGHPLHAAAWKWWQRQSDAHVALCWLTRMAVLRLLTNTKAMGGQPATLHEALVAWDALSADPRCLWLDADAAHEPFLRQFVTGRQSSPNLWSDAWLAALAASKGLQLTSFDADFRSFHLANFVHLKP